MGNFIQSLKLMHNYNILPIDTDISINELSILWIKNIITYFQSKSFLDASKWNIFLFVISYSRKESEQGKLFIECVSILSEKPSDYYYKLS